MCHLIVFHCSFVIYFLLLISYFFCTKSLFFCFWWFLSVAFGCWQRNAVICQSGYLWPFCSPPVFCSGMANLLSTLKLSFLHSFFSFFFYFIFLSCFLFFYSDGTHSGPERSKTVIQVEQGMTCSLSASISSITYMYVVILQSAH